MLGVEAAVRLLALQYAPLSALIGTRFTPDEAPQASATPAIVYSLNDDRRESNLSDDSRGISGLVITRIQFVSMATDTQSFRACKRVHGFLHDAIHGFRGSVANSASPAESLFIHRIDHKLGFSDNGIVTQMRIVESIAEVYHAERPPS